MIPTLGRIVHYTLTDADEEAANRRRSDAMQARAGAQASGFVVHVGNIARAGEVYPLLITRVWGEGEGAAVNGQVFLDGNDSLWVTSATEGEGPGRWAVPPRV